MVGSSRADDHEIARGQIVGTLKTTKDETMESITERADEVDKGVGAIRIPGCAKIGKPRTAATDLKEMRTGAGAAC